MSETRSTIQLIWGLALVGAGVGVLFRIPQVIPQLKQHEYFAAIIYFIYGCFYLLAALLIIGGGRKIVGYFKSSDKQVREETPSDPKTKTDPESD